MNNESRIKYPPKYEIGQAIQYVVKTEHKETKKIFENTIDCWIMAISASGTSEKDSYKYGLTIDMPGCYHNGENPFVWLEEDDLRKYINEYNMK